MIDVTCVESIHLNLNFLDKDFAKDGDFRLCRQDRITSPRTSNFTRSYYKLFEIRIAVWPLFRTYSIAWHVYLGVRPDGVAQAAVQLHAFNTVCHILNLHFSAASSVPVTSGNEADM